MLVKAVEAEVAAYIETHQHEVDEAGRRQGITDYVTQGIEAGVISDRATMVSALQRADLDVPRQGKHYLTVAEPGTDNKWRLKGAIFGRDFQRDERLNRAAPAAGRAGPPTHRGGDPDRARAVLRELEGHRAARATYYRARYPPREPAAERRDAHRPNHSSLPNVK